MDKTGEDWDRLRLGKFEKKSVHLFSIFFKIYVSLCGLDFANEKTLALRIWRLELIIDKIKQNFLK